MNAKTEECSVTRAFSLSSWLPACAKKKPGWSDGSGRWQHESLEHIFTMDQLIDNDGWGKASHGLPQSFRPCNELFDLDRREFRDGHIPAFSEQRIKLAKIWSNDCVGSFSSFSLAIGAIPSSAFRSIAFGQTSVCAQCGEIWPALGSCLDLCAPTKSSSRCFVAHVWLPSIS